MNAAAVRGRARAGCSLGCHCEPPGRSSHRRDNSALAFIGHGAIRASDSSNHSAHRLARACRARRGHPGGAAGRGANRARTVAELASRAIAVRRSALPGWVSALRLRQPGRAEGRHGAAERAGHVRQFQRGGGERQRPAGGRTRAHLQPAAGERVRRSDDDVRLAGRGGRLSSRPLARRLPPAARGALARRDTGDGRRRDLLLRNVEETRSRARRLLSPRSRSIRPAIASCR